MKDRHFEGLNIVYRHISSAVITKACGFTLKVKLIVVHVELQYVIPYIKI